MAAPRSQKRASANAGKTTATRGSTSRASSSRTSTPRSTSSRASAQRATSSRTSRASSASRGGRARLTSLIVIATIVFGTWAIYPVLRLQYENEREVRTLEQELDGLKVRNDELREQVDELKTPEGVEQLARESLGLVKPGEQAYVVTGGESAESSQTPSPDVEIESTMWESALDFVFGLN